MYENFINYDGKMFQTFEEYISYMKLNQMWGDNVKINAFLDIYGINVHVHVFVSK